MDQEYTYIYGIEISYISIRKNLKTSYYVSIYLFIFHIIVKALKMST